MAERFTALFDLFQRQEAEARRKLGIRERDRAQAVEQLAVLAAQRSAGAHAGVALREQLSRFWSRIGAEMAVVETAIAAADRAIVEARAELAEAHRQVATFAKLRERDRRAAQREGERREARRLDEFAALRFAIRAAARVPEEGSV